MTDNVAISAGSGTNIATDEIGGTHYQIVKLAWGALDTANIVAAASGKTLPTTIYNSTGTEITFNSNGQAVAASSAPVVMASDRQNSQSFKIPLTVDTSAYGTGDLIADTQVCTSFFNKTDGRGVIVSVTVVDHDIQNANLSIFFHKASTSMGTENSTPNISEANLQTVLQGRVDIGSGDYKTVSSSSVATVNCNIPVIAASGTSDLYVSVMSNGSTPTYTVSTNLNLTIGAVLD